MNPTNGCNGTCTGKCIGTCAGMAKSTVGENLTDILSSKLNARAILASIYNNPIESSNPVSTTANDTPSATPTMSCGCGDSCYVVCGSSCTTEVAAGTWAEDNTESGYTIDNVARLVSSSTSSIGATKIRSTGLINKSGGGR